VSLPGIDRAQADSLVAKAHQVCPYSNATRNNVDVGLTIVWDVIDCFGASPAVPPRIPALCP
jgi:hypothetical protein